MLSKPSSCHGCPLADLGEGFMVPQIGTNGVLLLGEALGEQEAKDGAPFVGRAGLRLTRLVEWAGFKREDFSIANTAFCRPPNNAVPPEDAIAHCRVAHWEKLLSRHRVIVPLGNTATHTLIGQGGILAIRGYPFPVSDRWCIPTVHPSFIQRGMSRWSAPFINDIQKAVKLAQEGMPPIKLDYILDPPPYLALQWAERAVQSGRPIAFDIETPWKDEEEDELDSEIGERIDRIGFSFESYEALSIPWSGPYFAAIRLILSSANPKVVWNAPFDVPHVTRAGFPVGGLIHDGMLMWHILHSDLKKSLQFVATFTCPWQPAWKHLNHSRPAFYNATDADVELRSFLALEKELRSTGLWEVYKRDIIDLEPILQWMHDQGMPIDQEARLEAALKLDSELKTVYNLMVEAIPLAARTIARVYKKEPKDDIKAGCLTRESTRETTVCSECGAEAPKRSHFGRGTGRGKQRVIQCGTGKPLPVERPFTEYYRLAPFKPSRTQLIKYHEVLGRACPTKWDKKTQTRKISFDEKALEGLAKKYPTDQLYKSILTYRKLDKVAGTYIGRPVNDK